MYDSGLLSKKLHGARVEVDASSKGSRVIDNTSAKYMTVYVLTYRLYIIKLSWHNAHAEFISVYTTRTMKANIFPP